MSELRRLQEQFQQFLLSGEPEIHRAIVETASVSVETRLGIYGEAYVLRLIESLTANFPCFYAYLGTEQFNQLAHSYIKAYPSSYRSIRWFGDSLAAFVTRYYPQHPHLTELADFEWHLTLAFDAADAPMISIADMTEVSPEAWANLQFTLHPSVQQRNYFWNTVPLWQALAHDQDLPELQCHSEAISWILWRSSDLMIQFASLSPDEAWSLSNLGQGASFAELCEGLCQWLAPEEVGMRAASYLKNWIQRGLLSRLIVGSPE